MLLFVTKTFSSVTLDEIPLGRLILYSLPIPDFLLHPLVAVYPGPGPGYPLPANVKLITISFSFILIMLKNNVYTKRATQDLRVPFIIDSKVSLLEVTYDLLMIRD